MKKSMFFLSAIVFLFTVGVACAGAFEGYITSMNNDKTSLVVKSDADKKEYRFECDKEAIPNSIKVKDHVAVQFTEESNVKKATKVKKAPIGC